MGTVSSYDMANIHACFGRGYDLNAYRGVTWYTDAGASGTFGTTPISISEFLGKRPDNPDPYPYDDAVVVTFDSGGTGNVTSLYGHAVSGGAPFIIGGGGNQVFSFFYTDGGAHHGALRFSVDGILGMTDMVYIGSGGWRRDNGSAIVSTPGTYTFRFEASSNV